MVDRPDHELEPRHWAWAHFLGAARTASNENTRGSASDRGASNQQVDLLGALGELFLLECALEAGADAAIPYMRAHLYCVEGGTVVDGPDLQFVDDAGEWRHLDVHLTSRVVGRLGLSLWVAADHHRYTERRTELLSAVDGRPVSPPQRSERICGQSCLSRNLLSVQPLP